MYRDRFISAAVRLSELITAWSARRMLRLSKLISGERDGVNLNIGVDGRVGVLEVNPEE